MAIPQLRIIRFWWNLVCRYKFWFQERSRDKKKTKFCISRQNRPDARHMTKIPNFECLIWLPAFWQWFYRYISAANHPISMKFDVQMQIFLPRMAAWQKKKSNFCKHTREHLPNENRLVVDGKTISLPVYIRNSGVARLWVTWGPPFPSPPLPFPSSFPPLPQPSPSPCREAAPKSS